MQYFKPYTKQDLLSVTHIRRFETKLGEIVQPLLAHNISIEDNLKASNALFVIVGVPEDIGIKANKGIGGADSAWMPFLQSFLNSQSNDFFSGAQVMVAGHFDFSSISGVIENNAASYDEKVEAYKLAVNTIDDAVEKMIKEIVKVNKIPIVIGGGHNNAYPCIKGAAKALYKMGQIPLAQINAINIDAHADYRPAEGRHSGNAFRYAEEDGFLQKYCAVAVHENYLTQNMWIDMVNNPFMDLITYEDIFIREKQTFTQALKHAFHFTSDNFCGIELDVDAIANTLSSAVSPVGIGVDNARKYVQLAAQKCKVAYLHIAEAATQLNDSRRNDLTGKLISYLVTDFMKAFND